VADMKKKTKKSVWKNYRVQYVRKVCETYEVKARTRQEAEAKAQVREEDDFPDDETTLDVEITVEDEDGNEVKE